MIKHKRYLIALIILINLQTVSAQVSISPTSLFIDSRQPYATLTIMNRTAATQEVSLDFVFGYPVTDSLGNTMMVYDDSVKASHYSIADMVRGFPRRFVLEPGQRQTVRMTVRPDAQLENGVYWTRIKTTSNPESPPVEESTDGQVNPQITIQFEQLTTLFYKVGEVNTGLSIEDVTVLLGSERAKALTKVEVHGNAPYLGTLNLSVYNTNQELVKEDFTFVSIYQDGISRIEFDTSDLPPGEYTTKINFITNRNDVNSNHIVKAPPVTGQTHFVIQ